MWQRIQTLFLAVTIIALLISLILPLWQGQLGGSTIVLTPFYLLNGDQYNYIPYSAIAMLAVAGITIALIEMRRFDNRIVQMKLGALNTLLLAGLMICVYVFTNNLTTQYPISSPNQTSLFLIFAAVLCNWLALRFIRRDERLVRDSERLR